MVATIASSTAVPPCPLVATHCHLGLVWATSGSHQRQHHLVDSTYPQYSPPALAALGNPAMVAMGASSTALPPVPPHHLLHG